MSRIIDEYGGMLVLALLSGGIIVGLDTICKAVYWMMDMLLN